MGIVSSSSLPQGMKGTEGRIDVVKVFDCGEGCVSSMLSHWGRVRDRVYGIFQE